MIILARHGQTDANARGVLQGRGDLALTDLGRRQALALASALGGRRGIRPPALVVSSPLRRALETTELLVGTLAQRGMAPLERLVDDRWVELDYGDWEGSRPGSLDESAWLGWQRDPAWAPPGGESMTAVEERVRAACDDLVLAAREADVVVVSHVSPIKAAVAWALGSGIGVSWRLRLDQAAVSRIGVSAGGAVLLSWNETGHLDDDTAAGVGF